MNSLTYHINMKDLIYKGPLNSLSFGNVSFNLLKEMYNQDMNVAIFPHGNVDVSSFGSISKDLKQWVEKGVNDRYSMLNPDTTTLQMWHLSEELSFVLLVEELQVS